MAPRTLSAPQAPAGAALIGGRRWCKPPQLGGAAPTGPGLAEIKPHSPVGLAEGLRQLRARTPDSPRFLLTYLPVALTRGKAAGLRVFAIGFGNTKEVPAGVAGLRGRSWADLGRITIPSEIPFPPVDDAGFFGSAVERLVRLRFGRKLVWPAGRQLTRGTGGHKAGADVMYQELAAFSAALARELNDPMLAELAAELDGRTAPTRPPT